MTYPADLAMDSKGHASTSHNQWPTNTEEKNEADAHH